MATLCYYPMLLLQHYGYPHQVDDVECHALLYLLTSNAYYYCCYGYPHQVDDVECHALLRVVGEREAVVQQPA